MQLSLNMTRQGHFRRHMGKRGLLEWRTSSPTDGNRTSGTRHLASWRSVIEICIISGKLLSAWMVRLVTSLPNSGCVLVRLRKTPSQPAPIPHQVRVEKMRLVIACQCKKRIAHHSYKHLKTSQNYSFRVGRHLHSIPVSFVATSSYSLVSAFE